MKPRYRVVRIAPLGEAMTQSEAHKKLHSRTKCVYAFIDLTGFYGVYEK